MTARRQEKRKREGHFYESEDEEGFDASVGSSGGCEDSKDGITSVMSITCNACRQKKTKCSSDKPSCSACAKAGTLCIYRQRLKPGLKRGAGEATNRRLDMLEAQVKDQQARIFQLEHAQHLINGAASTLTGLTPTTSTSTNSAPSVINGTNNLPRTNPAFPCTTAAPSSQLFSAPPPSLTTNWQPQTSPMLSQPHFASPSANSLHASDHTSPQTVTGRSEDSRAVLDALPPPLVQSLLNVYEQYLAPSLPLFPPHSPHQWPWTLPVYAMVAAALRLPQGGLLLSNAESVRYAARNHVITSATESTSVESVQALTILVLETISSGAEPSNWGTLALLTRSIRHLGLVDNLRDGAEKGRLCLIPRANTPQEAESHRRLFWCIWMLDRYTCASTGWDLAISDEETCLELPSADTIWDVAQTVQPGPMFVSILADDKVAALDGLHEMATLVRIVDILGRVAMLQSSQPIIFNRSDAFELHHRSQEARMLYIGLEKAMAALPKALVDAVLSGRGTSMQTLVFGTYHATTLKLVANLAYPVGKAATVQEPFFKISRDSIAASAKLAKAVVHAGRGSEMPPLLAWCLWVAARISFIDSYMMRCAPSQEFEAVLELLQVMSRTWALADKYTKALQKASQSWKQHLSSDQYDSSNHLPVISALVDFKNHAYSALRADSGTPPELSTFSLADLYSWLQLPDLAQPCPEFNGFDAATYAPMT